MDSWPRNTLEKSLGHNYGFTAEYHNFFRFQNNQKFEFSGDDDVWVFIDDKLVLDLGGVHGELDGVVDLNTLGLKEGQIYTFDFFYAERHTTKSNFKFTTSIVELCNVLQNYEEFFNSSKLGLDAISDYLALRHGTVSPLALEFKEDYGALAFLKPVTVINGFSLDMTFKIENAIADRPGSSGAIQVTIMSTVNPSRKLLIFISHDGEVTATLPSGAATSKIVKRLYNITDGKPHLLKIEYLGTPSWLRVYVDDMYAPLLNVKDIDMVNELGSGGSANVAVELINSRAMPAWESFTITSLSIDIVAVNPAASFIIDGTLPRSATTDDSVSARLQLADECSSAIKSGGKAERINAFYESASGERVGAFVSDNNDGSYNLDAHIVTTGDYKIRATYNGMQMQIDDSLVVHIDSGVLDVEKATIDGFGGSVMSTASANATCAEENIVCKSFGVIIRDKFNNVPSDTDISMLEISLLNEDRIPYTFPEEQLLIKWDPTSLLWRVKFAVSKPGQYDMYIKIDDKSNAASASYRNLPSSPFSISVGVTPVIDLVDDSSDKFIRKEVAIPLGIGLFIVALISIAVGLFTYKKYREYYNSHKNDRELDEEDNVRTPLSPANKDDMEAIGSAATYDMLKSKRDALAQEAADLRRTYKPMLDEEKELSAAITTLKQVQQHAVDTDISTGPIQKKRVEFEGKEEKDMVTPRAEATI
jgi:fibro-slime domain-containing protein